VPRGGAEYTGQFSTTLVPNVEDFEQIVFKASGSERWSAIGQFPSDTHFASGRLISPITLQYTVLSLLVEESEKDPVVYVDLNGDDQLSSSEKLALTKIKADNPFLWKATANLQIKNSFFTECPIFVRYFKSIQTEKMTEDDRLVTQSTEVMARGSAMVKGNKVLVQYAYNFQDKRVTPQNGLLGVDVDGDGEIDMDNLSPESTKADNEEVVFRAGQIYISTKKADLDKNQIILREHEAKDYKRVELQIGKNFPEFNFVDFDGKKHSFSEFRGKFVLLDIWGFWCPPCRKELPYIREAFRMFQGRNLEVVGLNTDEDFTPESMKDNLNKNGMKWTQATLESVHAFLREGLRINSFPTTFLISPEGKILSMSRQERDEPDLRGKDLLESLDKALPKQISHQ
jgi:peroxiredoxin